MDVVASLTKFASAFFPFSLLKPNIGLPNIWQYDMCTRVPIHATVASVISFIGGLPLISIWLSTIFMRIFKNIVSWGKLASTMSTIILTSSPTTVVITVSTPMYNICFWWIKDFYCIFLMGGWKPRRSKIMTFQKKIIILLNHK